MAFRIRRNSPFDVLAFYDCVTDEIKDAYGIPCTVSETGNWWATGSREKSSGFGPIRSLMI